MPVDEFSLIQRYFDRPVSAPANENIILGIGDDAAVVRIPEHHQLVQTMDTLVSGRHFPVDTDPALIAYKSLAVNVSDLVAMGASPSFFLLSLTLPQVDEKFLDGFCDGLFLAAQEFGIQLIGGDTCKGPLSISIQASGLVPEDEYITRSGAQLGDQIFVSGQLGTAALGLGALQGKIALPDEIRTRCINALHKPQPRLDLILLLRQFASAAIDLSDGLVGDLRHILQKSSVGALIHKAALPVEEFIQRENIYDYVTQGGDDYQILFTVAGDRVDELQKQAATDDIDLTRIGMITDRFFIMNTADGEIDLALQRGFDHFAQ